MDFFKRVEKRIEKRLCSKMVAPCGKVQAAMSPAGAVVVPRNILCYGDSLTAGFCDSGRHFTPYGKRLEAELVEAGLDCKTSVMGLSGHEAKQMLRELASPTTKRDITGFVGHGLGWMLDRDRAIDLVIIMAGTNDLGLPGASAEAILRDVQQLHAACHARGIRTIAVAPPSPIRPLRAQLSQMIRHWAGTEEQILGFFDPEKVLPRSDATLWEADTVHFSDVGSRTLGERLSTDILRTLAGFGSLEARTHLNNLRRRPSQGGA